MGNRKIILAIDDNVFQLQLYREMLVPEYDLRAVKAASEALSFLNMKKADLILLDIEMPKTSGFEFLNDIKKIPGNTNVPVIIVSGNSGTEFFDQAGKSGAAGVLTKPVIRNVLISTIEKALAAEV
ncbi:MAG: response regulator [Treponema sp.]|jgi:CheY-like chemotaxis protein|nr:response regulator [Treponema sp.]